MSNHGQLLLLSELAITAGLFAGAFRLAASQVGVQLQTLELLARSQQGP